MEKFGPQGYFVTIQPGSFKTESFKVDVDNTILNKLSFVLSYSANYHVNNGTVPQPQGSGYHWTLSRVSLGITQNADGRLTLKQDVHNQLHQMERHETVTA